MTRRRVLLVEDEPIVAIDLEQTLTELGYEVTGVAASSDAALRSASERCPEVVLMDIRIQGAMDGITTAELLKARYDLPVIYLTAHADHETLERAKRSAPHGYLLKPVRPDELHSTIEVVTHRHQLEQKGRLRERWSATMEGSAEGMISVNIQGDITFLNEAAALMLGVSAREAVGRPIEGLVRLFDVEASKPLVPAVRAVLRDGRPVAPRDVLLADPTEGGARPISESASPIVEGGRVAGAVMLCRDRTQEKVTQLRLEQTDRLAVLGTMAASVAHEINNPLSVVTANADYIDEQVERLITGLQGSPFAEPLGEIASSLADIRSASTRIARIVGDLRDFARPAPPRPGHVDVAHSIEWAIRATAHHLRHRARLIRSITPVPPVSGDEVRLGQVMVNVLVNAADAITPGAVEKNTITVATRVGDDGRVIIEVQDSGGGMSPEVRSRIFEPFFTTKPRAVGSGLGLAICQGIVKSFGGDIEVDSAPGEGTLVRLLIPPAHDGPPDQEPSEDLGIQLRGRVLVIDDELMVLRAVERTLHDHEVISVDSVAAALRLIDAGEQFDVILSDVMMPEQTGFDFYEALLDRSPAFAESVVFLTGDASGSSKMDDFLRAVANPILHKPFQSTELRQLVQRMLVDRRDSRTSDLPDAPAYVD